VRIRRKRLLTPTLGFWVDVRLLRANDRWLAVASIAGDPEIGLGHSDVAAVEAALASLGKDAVADLLRGSSLKRRQRTREVRK